MSDPMDFKIHVKILKEDNQWIVLHGEKSHDSYHLACKLDEGEEEKLRKWMGNDD